MQKSVFLLLILGLLVGLAHASTSLGLRTLVLTEGNSVQYSHSEFFQILKDLGHTLKFSDVQETVIALKTVDKYNYDNVFVFASKSEELGGGNIKTQDLVDFVDNGGSLFVGANEEGLSETLRSVAITYGIDFDEDVSYVSDAVNQLDVSNALYESSATQPIVKVDVSGVRSLVQKGQVLFSGLGQLLVKSRFARSVVHGGAGSISQNPTATDTLVSGTNLSLVTAVQTLGNGRILFTGSLAAYSNEYFAAKEAQNRAVLSSSVHWVVHASGYLRLREPTNYDTVDGQKRGIYKVNDPVSVHAILEEYDGATWIPYISDKVIFEAIMLDPYVRQKIQVKDSKTGLYHIDIIAPDTHGVYKFRISVNEFATEGEGVAFIQNDVMVPIRPYRHDEYDRFMFVATPYYAGTIGVLAAFFLFSALFLYSK